MRNKLITTALVLGFSFAPISAFADSVTTIQGGTPTYSCPEGSQIVDTDKCYTPERTIPTPAQTAPANQSNVNGYRFVYRGGYMPFVWYHAGNTYNSGDVIPNVNSSTDITGCWSDACETHPLSWWYGWANVSTVSTTLYTCPNGTNLVGENCVTPASSSLVPASTTSANISGANNGSIVASIAGFFTPVWNFLTGRLLPAITALVVLAIGVRLSIKAVRKFSKVA